MIDDPPSGSRTEPARSEPSSRTACARARASSPSRARTGASTTPTRSWPPIRSLRRTTRSCSSERRSLSPRSPAHGARTSTRTDRVLLACSPSPSRSRLRHPGAALSLGPDTGMLTGVAVARPRTKRGGRQAPPSSGGSHGCQLGCVRGDPALGVCDRRPRAHGSRRSGGGSRRHVHPARVGLGRRTETGLADATR
jgi:hypothetical protein